MKKRFIYGLMCLMASLSFTACSDKEHTDTKVTNYILLTINGDKDVYVDANSTYEDAGCKAESAGQDVSDQIVTINTVDTKVIGPYSVIYKATNDDGFSSSATRNVYVGSPLVSVVAEGSYRQNAAGTVTNYSGYAIDLLTDGEGLYWVEDLLGGYYEQRAGYGAAYSMKGFLQVNDDNTVDLVDGGHVEGWGDDYDDFKNGKYDPAANTISYTVVYANMDFNVILTLK